MVKVDVETIGDELTVVTSGLADVGHMEILARVSNSALVPEAEAFLGFVVDYLNSSGVSLSHEQTLAYGYWLTRFVKNCNILEAWEYTPDAVSFVPGITQTLKYWHEQHEVCERHRAEFLPPRPDRLVVISEGVIEGDQDVQGVRYPSPEHMSGWWLTTGRYKGDTASLKTTHAYHVTASRPELARLFALPYGFRFDLSRGDNIWFDEEVASGVS
jgi:hypothetical protein